MHGYVERFGWNDIKKYYNATDPDTHTTIIVAKWAWDLRYAAAVTNLATLRLQGRGGKSMLPTDLMGNLTDWVPGRDMGCWWLGEEPAFMAPVSSTVPMAPAAVGLPMAQSVMTFGLTPDVAALAERGNIPAALLTVLAGYALEGLDTNRQAAILADLGTGRIGTVAALRKRCGQALAAQRTEAARGFAWGQ